MKILVWVEYDVGGIKDVMLSVIIVVLQFGEVYLIVVGKGVDGVVVDVVKIVGVGKVYVVDDVVFDYVFVENVVLLIVELMVNSEGGYDVFVVFVMVNGKNIVLCVVVLFDVMQISEILLVESVDIFICLIYVGNVIVIVQLSDVKKVIIVCGILFVKVECSGGSGIVEVVVLIGDKGLFLFVGVELLKFD